MVVTYIGHMLTEQLETIFKEFMEISSINLCWLLQLSLCKPEVLILDQMVQWLDSFGSWNLNTTHPSCPQNKLEIYLPVQDYICCRCNCVLMVLMEIFLLANRVAKLIGDKRAVVAERGFNRPYLKVVITNCGLI